MNIHTFLLKNSPELEAIQMLITYTDKYNYCIAL